MRIIHSGKQQQISGAIFDMDGTLLDSMKVWCTVGEDYLKSKDIEPRPELNKIFKDMSLYQSACYYQSEYGLTDDAQTIMDEINAMVEYAYRYEVLPKPGVIRFLDLLKSNNVRMCIATATDRHLVEAVLKRNEMSDYFEDILTCTSVGSGKDEPEIFNTAHLSLNTPRDTTWVFEDALYAIRTAKKAGFLIAGISDEYQPDQADIRRLSDIYIQPPEWPSATQNLIKPIKRKGLS